VYMQLERALEYGREYREFGLYKQEIMVNMLGETYTWVIVWRGMKIVGLETHSQECFISGDDSDQRNIFFGIMTRGRRHRVEYRVGSNLTITGDISHNTIPWYFEIGNWKNSFGLLEMANFFYVRRGKSPCEINRISHMDWPSNALFLA